MELTQIGLGLLTLVVAMLGWFFTRLQSTMDRLERNINHCQNNMPKEYVLKDDHKSDISEIKAMITDQSKKIDQIWKSLRTDK